MNHYSSDKKKVKRRKYRRIMAGLTGAMLLSSGMLHHPPTAKAASPGWEEVVPDKLNNIWLQSRDVIRERVTESLNRKIEETIAEKKEEIGKAVIEKFRSASKKSSANKVLDITATAYASGYEDNGIWNDKTHIGTKVRPGIIAVDPKVIPLGSKVYIEFPDGKGMYAVAEDTGGAIKGNRIDIAMSTRDKAKKFGIQDVKVHVLEKGTRIS